MKRIRPFYGISKKICGRYLGSKKERSRRIRLRERLCSLHPMERADSLIREYYIERLELLFAVGLFCGLGILLACMLGRGQGGKSVTELERNSYGQEEKESSVQVFLGKEPPETIQVTLGARIYTGEESRKLLKQAADRLEKLILAENPAPDQVTSDLNLVTEMEDGLIKVSWQADPPYVVDLGGHLDADVLTEEGTPVQLQACLTMQDESLIRTFAVNVKKPAMTEQEKQLEALEDQIERAEKESRTKRTVSLPEKLGNLPVSYREPEAPSSWPALALLFPAAAVLLFRRKEAALDQALKDRDRQLQMDYPAVINQLTLLYCAGLTIRDAWFCTALEYGERKKRGKAVRYAYEEMLLTCWEMERGVPEAEAYDRFGRRCRLAGYVKLGELLRQNLKKGSKGLVQMLLYESVQATEERKNLAKRLGEEASTKLLIPMFLMLAVVLVILVVPAFLSMQVA